MTYKETLLFIGKCLTLDHDKENKILVEERLQANSIDWDNVVRLSTAHYVYLHCSVILVVLVI
jgi:hypothetical protein